MYLKSIKLVGFKSFVDPTLIPIRTGLNAIVGPNGCGKSNVVDAIRWVVGETSAKQLRGQSMTDVIFNGTTSRKPVGKASVELIFDNREGRIGGEFAKYAELCIKREVTRDGQSSYYINGGNCRRKDIVHIFLGTGLGPRSYAVIEQGMVSRLIEAKPDELRVYIEEAAGISKYKERRKETETRIRHTQENLDRLRDIIDELDKQLEKLNRQSKAAERYKLLCEEERLMQAQVKALQWQKFQQQREVKDREINEEANRREEKVTHLRELETTLEKTRTLHHAAQDEQQKIQASYYQAGTEIARLEQQLNDLRARSQTWEAELNEATQLLEEIETTSADYGVQIIHIEQEIRTLIPQTEKAEERQAEARQCLMEAEARMSEWQVHWEQLQEKSSRVSEAAEVGKTKLAHYQEQIQRLEMRFQDLRSRHESRTIQSLEAEITPLRARASEQHHSLQTLQQEIETLNQTLETQRQRNDETEFQLDEARETVTRLESREATLKALQASTLHQNDEAANTWMSRYHWDKAPRLAEKLQVESGWETAVETVLGAYVDAVCVDSLDAALETVGDLDKGRVTFVSLKAAMPSLSEYSLAHKVQGEWAKTLLADVLIAHSANDAKTRRSQLKPHQSFITVDGIWVGSQWMSVARVPQEGGGILFRERELHELASHLEEAKQTLREAEAAYERSEETLLKLSTEREEKHHAIQSLTQVSAQVTSELSAKNSRLEALQQQSVRLQEEMHEAEMELFRIKESKAQAESHLASSVASKQTLEVTREQLLSEREGVKRALEEARDRAHRLQSEADEAKVRLVSNENQLVLLRESMARNTRQSGTLAEKKQVLLANLSDKDAPLERLEQALQSHLTNRQGIEAHLRQAEATTEQYVQQLVALEKERQALQQKLSDWQSHLESLRMERQTLLINQDNLVEQIQELKFDVEGVRAALPPEAEITQWRDQLTELQNKIQRLGPINLAAIDEFHELNERKEYLDKQRADLQEALDILEQAIQKIDKETKTKFKETYDLVNVQFMRLFPHIFGGGSAELELTSDDLLSAGISVKAQPPGKRNSTIHMLSGGEKALTAIALVFGLFELNPAPFCILDEVDAPLDDANVGRYCQLIKNMSKSTQFIIISHNKSTIASAEQLMGVTMHEPGVSRIVSVDMEQAIAMAE
ncbi:MAG TPA: chromosome segregation protein SMC [Coxiellaceae bacterium]|nr:chromosome segregation protein SMC [Coxiellaceae bacterium]